MTQILGILAAAATLYSALRHLGQGFGSYYDVVALLMVVGGTVSVALVSFSSSEIFDFARTVLSLSKRVPNGATLVPQFIRLAQSIQTSTKALAQLANDPKADPFLRDGLELLLGGFPAEEIELVLNERIYTQRLRDENLSTMLRTLSKYPPAFGLMGTVLGLVSVMRSLGEGSTPEETGLHMAVALVATFYGLILTNFVLQPIGEYLLGRAKRRVLYQKIILEGILLLHEKASPLLVQELLNSYLNSEKRNDHLGLKKEAA